ncbi:hypothetical protein Taro_051351 [Colocasia esculenta]|uniref:Uncharacterized protein n=1 Tax=Colocasia esculenta TaxID=4460 RepID=A0A843XGI5_COLES|nr:hypothetical protein [Colocasia esculenta]
MTAKVSVILTVKSKIEGRHPDVKVPVELAADRRQRIPSPQKRNVAKNRDASLDSLKPPVERG